MPRPRQILLLAPLAWALAAPTLDAQPLRFEATHRSLPATATDTRDFEVADLDGDGDLDVFSPTGPSRLLRNDGLSVFEDVTTSHWPGGSARDAALADFDRDGDVDIVLLAPSGTSLRAFANDGTARFTEVTGRWLNSNPSNAWFLHAADTDGDGDQDLLIGCSAGRDLLLRNDGSGRFTDVTTTHLPAGFQRTRGAAFGDVDGDGDPDVVVVGSGSARLYRNDGAGRFTDDTVGNLAATPHNQQSLLVACADVEGDGDLDLLFGGDAVRPGCFVNDGSGRFTDESTARVPAQTGGWAAYGLAVTDLDRDGDPDLVLATSQAVHVSRNDGSGHFVLRSAASPVEPTLRPNSLTIGDLDADRDPDLLLTSFSGTSELWCNDGTGKFGDATPDGLAFENDGMISDGVLHDVDGDGDRDLILAVGRPSDRRPNLLLLQGDDGAFRAAPAGSLPTDSRQTRAVAAGDLDGDGNLDLLYGNAFGEQDQLLLGDGSGNFSNDVTATHLPARSDWTEDLELGDLDGDGDLDVFVARFRQPDDVLLNDGSGRLRSASGALPPLAPADQVTTRVDLVDLDGDGDLDAVTATWSRNRIYRNDGSGTFTDISGRSWTNAPSDDVGVADVDGDGDPDLLFAEQAGADTLWLNDGSGRFTAAPAGSVPGHRFPTYRVTLADVDEDGDLDLIRGLVQSGERIALNDGSGRFTATLAYPSDHAPELLLAEDYDEDGDTDLLAASFYEQRLLPNRRRQLAWSGLPRVGLALRLQIDGPPGGVHLLNVAGLPAHAPTPFGTLRVDPSTLVLSIQGSLDARGSAETTLPVPNLPTLTGFTLYWQALVSDGSSFRATNLEPTTFLGR